MRNPPVTGEEDGDAIAGLSGCVDVAAGFVVPEGPLVVAQRLTGVPAR